MTQCAQSQSQTYIVRQEDYTSPEFARLEKDRMWPRTWLAVCREQEIPKVGDTFAYEICEDSIFIVRSADDAIRAFYNVCPHRGRMLVTAGRRRSTRFHCPFHGWTFDLEGNCTHVHYPEDWGDDLALQDTSLSAVRCETWAGWVFINQDQGAQPLRDYLDLAAERLDPFEFDRQQIAWNCSVVVNANWKVVLEAFAEGYHIRATHPQQSPVLDHERMRTQGAGLHGYLGSNPALPMIEETKPIPERTDIRPIVLEFIRQLAFDVASLYSPRDMTAATRIMTEMKPTTNEAEVQLAIMNYRKEAAIAAGVGWPDMTIEELFMGAAVWQIFPNMIVLTGPTASLWYRTTPLGSGDNPESCVLEFMALERFVEGFSPEIRKRHFADWQDLLETLPSFLAQDFANLPFMQKGVRSRGFRGAILNPLQEEVIANHHRQLRRLMGLDE